MDDMPLHSIGGDVAEQVVSRVKDIQDKVAEDSRNLLSQGQAFALNADEYLSRISTSLVDPVLSPFPVVGTIELPTLTDREDIVLRSLATIDLPNLADFSSTLGAFDPSAFDIDMPSRPDGEPSITVPTLPIVTLGDAPTKPIVDTSLNMPDRPDISFPSPPVLHGVVLPSMPIVTLPTLSATLPVWEGGDAPGSDISAAVGDINLDKARFELFVDMALGGVPKTYTDVVEQELARISDQHMLQAQRAVQGVFEEFAVRGFTAPPGVVGKRTDVIRADAAEKVRLASRELAISRMGMEIDVYKANLSTGASLVSKELELDLSASRLSLEVATSHAKQMLDSYNAEVAVFNAIVQSYGAVVEVFKAQIEGETAKVEIYKAQIEGAKTTLEVDNTAMRGYESQLKGIQTSVDVYKAIVGAAETELNAKVKQMDMFRSEVEAYVAEVNAAKSRYDMYDSQVKASLVPLEVYKSRMDAYGTEMQGVKIEADVIKTKADVAFNREDANIKAYVATIDGMSKRSMIALEQVKIDAQMIRNEMDVALESAKLDNEDDRLKLEAYKAELAAAVSKFEAAATEWSTLSKLATEKFGMKLEAAKASATVAGQLASAALAGFHVQESVSASSSLGFSAGASGSWTYNKTEERKNN